MHQAPHVVPGCIDCHGGNPALDLKIQSKLMCCHCIRSSGGASANSPQLTSANPPRSDALA